MATRRTEHASPSPADERVAELVDVLAEAKRTIKALHGPIAWDIYDGKAPEMKRINSTLAKHAPGEATS